MNYTALAAMATKLLAKNGASMTFERDSTRAADPTKPWRGPDPNPTVPPDPADAKTITANAVIVPLEIDDEKNSGVRIPMKSTMYVEAALAEADTYNRVNDGENTWKICDVQPLRPAGPGSLVCWIMELEG